MAKAPKKTAGVTDLQAAEAELKGQGLDYDLLEYSHAYVDLIWKDAEGVRQKREFKPDGAELHRDAAGAEVGV
jgi:hypothetical protein